MSIPSSFFGVMPRRSWRGSANTDGHDTHFIASKPSHLDTRSKIPKTTSVRSEITYASCLTLYLKMRQCIRPPSDIQISLLITSLYLTIFKSPASSTGSTPKFSLLSSPRTYQRHLQTTQAKSLEALRSPNHRKIFLLWLEMSVLRQKNYIADDTYISGTLASLRC